MKTSFLSLIAVLLCTGCAHQPLRVGPQCPRASWYDEGFSYHQKGRSQEELQTAINLCLATGQAVDSALAFRGYQDSHLKECTSTASAFQKGSRGEPISPLCNRQTAPTFYEAWDNGLRTYCVPEVGLALGRAGGSYKNICPPELEGLFLAAYEEGKGIHREIQSWRGQTEGLDRRLRDLSVMIQENQRLIDRLSIHDSQNPRLAQAQEDKLLFENQYHLLEDELSYLEGKILRTEVQK